MSNCLPKYADFMAEREREIRDLKAENAWLRALLAGKRVREVNDETLLMLFDEIARRALGGEK